MFVNHIKSENFCDAVDITKNPDAESILNFSSINNLQQQDIPIIPKPTLCSQQLQNEIKLENEVNVSLYPNLKYQTDTTTNYSLNVFNLPVKIQQSTSITTDQYSNDNNLSKTPISNKSLGLQPEERLSALSLNFFGNSFKKSPIKRDILIQPTVQQLSSERYLLPMNINGFSIETKKYCLPNIKKYENNIVQSKHILNNYSQNNRKCTAKRNKSIAIKITMEQVLMSEILKSARKSMTFLIYKICKYDIDYKFIGINNKEVIESISNILKYVHYEIIDKDSYAMWLVIDQELQHIIDIINKYQIEKNTKRLNDNNSMTSLFNNNLNIRWELQFNKDQTTNFIIRFL